MRAIDIAIEKAGGASALASRLGASKQRVSNWRRRGRIPDSSLFDVAAAIGERAEALHAANTRARAS